MDDQQNNFEHPITPRRRTPDQSVAFKETYLPIAIIGAALIMVLVFMIGSVSRGIQRIRYNKDLALKESIAAAQMREALDAEASDIIDSASLLASQFDYEGAIQLIDGFSGNISDYPTLSEKKDAYVAAKEELILWDDPSDVLSLSLHILIEDAQRAFTDETYGTSYNRNFLTTAEFRTVLQQLYENGYILVSLEDINQSSGMSLYLPPDKKPLLLTQTNVNYYTYMTDSNGDTLPDAGGDGFASKLIIDANGNISCQLTDAQDQIVTGAYDMVPILESFIQTHPGFSYKNAKAVLAVTGYDGIFGYRINPEAKERLGEDGYQAETAAATALCEKLKHLGYELACYSYNNEAYGVLTAQQISNDLEKWDSYIAPIMGKTDIFAYAQNSDIGAAGSPYSGEKMDILINKGFKNYLGFCDGNNPWFVPGNGYFRIGRIQLTGSTLYHHSDWFEGILDPAAILDPARGEVPA